MNIFSSLTQFDFVNVIRRRNETASLEEGFVPVSLLGEGNLFTPIASDVTGSVTINNGCYSRSGQVVTMSFQFDAEAAAGTSDIAFDFTLPVPSVFTNGRQLFGSNSSRVDLSSCGFQSISDKGRISIETSDVDLILQNITVTIQYFIL